MIQGGKKITSRSALARDAVHNPAAFASLSGRIDAIAHMRREAKHLLDSEREVAKAVCDATHSHLSS
jgi:hypothetical protein